MVREMSVHLPICPFKVPPALQKNSFFLLKKWNSKEFPPTWLKNQLQDNANRKKSYNLKE